MVPLLCAQCSVYVLFFVFDVALDILMRHSGIVWDLGRFRGIAPRREREEVGEPLRALWLHVVVGLCGCGQFLCVCVYYR